MPKRIRGLTIRSFTETHNFCPTAQSEQSEHFEKDQTMQINFDSSLRAFMKDPVFYIGHLTASVITFQATNAAIHFHDAVEALSFYGVTHSDPGNQLVHFIFVPFLVWTLLLALAHFSISSRTIRIPGAPEHNITYATYWFVGLPLFYMTLDLVAGVWYTLFLYMLYTSAVSLHAYDQKRRSSGELNSAAVWALGKYLRPWLGTGSILQWAPMVHAIGWIAQIVMGHMHLEGNLPAATSSFGGAIVVSPLFAFFEGLWFLGIRTSLQDRINGEVSSLMYELCKEGATMRACESIM